MVRLMPLALLGLALTACGKPQVELLETDQPQYQITRKQFPGAGERAIHAIGIYEANSDHGPGASNHPTRPVRIEIADQGGRAIQLALSSYEPVTWHVTGAGAVAVKGVFIDGYNSSTISGASGARVVNHSGRAEHPDDLAELSSDWGDRARIQGSRQISCTYTYPGPSGGGCQAGIDFVRKAEAVLFARAVSFTGVYNGAAFRIPNIAPEEVD